MQVRQPEINPRPDTDWASIGKANRPFDEARMRAAAYLDNGNFFAAEKVCLNAISAAAKQRGKVNDEPLRAILADALLDQGRLREALAIYLSHPDNGSNLSPQVIGICIAYCRLGDRVNALKWFREIERTQGWAFRYGVAGKQVDTHDWPSVKSLPGIEASALIIRGLCALSAHQDRALRDFLNANKLAPTSALTAYRAARILEEKGRFDDSESYYRRAATLGHGVIGADATKRQGIIANVKAISTPIMIETVGK